MIYLVVMNLVLSMLFIIFLIQGKKYAWCLLFLQNLVGLSLDVIAGGFSDYTLYRLSIYIMFMLVAIYIFFLKDKTKAFEKNSIKTFIKTILYVVIFYLLTCLISPLNPIYTKEFVYTRELLLFNFIDFIAVLAIVFLANRSIIGLFLVLVWKILILDISLYFIVQNGMGNIALQLINILSLIVVIAIVFINVKKLKNI